jgi:hypothetical protein
MNIPERNEKLAQLLGISIQSLELRLQRSIPLIENNKNKSDNARAKNEKVTCFDMAEAQLLNSLMIELDKI